MSTENEKPWPWKFERTTERCKCGGWTEVFTGIGKGKLSDEYCVNDIRLIGGGNHMRGCPERPDTDALEAATKPVTTTPALIGEIDLATTLGGVSQSIGHGIDREHTHLYAWSDGIVTWTPERGTDA